MPASHRQPLNPHPLANRGLLRGRRAAAHTARLPLAVWLAAGALASVWPAPLRERAAQRQRPRWSARRSGGGPCFEGRAAGLRGCGSFEPGMEEGIFEAGAALELTGVLSRAPEVAPDRYFVALEVEG